MIAEFKLRMALAETRAAYRPFALMTHTIILNPHMNMRGPRGPRKSLKAAQLGSVWAGGGIRTWVLRFR